jgi:hypothetical protein
VPADVTELTLAQKYFEEILYQISWKFSVLVAYTISEWDTKVALSAS